MNVSKLCIDPSNTSEDTEPIVPLSFHSDRISIASVNNSSSINVHNSSSNTKTNSNLYEYNDQQQKQQQHPIATAAPISNSSNHSNYNNNHGNQQQNQYLLKNVIDRCKLLQNNMSQYRDQPLTEALRSSLLDQVHCATVNMLESLAILEKDFTLESDNINSNNDHINNINTNSFPDTIPEESKQEYSIIRQARNITETSRPKYRRRSKRSMAGQRCHSCNTTETPEWRRGPDGARTLCNACGLHYSKLLRKRSLTVQTHNYLLNQQSEEDKISRIIQFPIVQMSTPNSNSSNDNHGYNLMRLPNISISRASTTSSPSTPSSHPTIYELSESEAASMQRDSWRQS